MIFWITVTALLTLALALLLIPLMRAARVSQTDQRQKQNIQIAREKKTILETQLAEGEIDQADYDAAYLDLQAALALELERDEEQGEATRGKWMALVVMLAIPCASITLYLTFGEYRVIDNPQPKDCSIIEVTVKNMTAGDTKDIIFHDEKNNYHINRGLDLGINIESLNAKVLNKTVSLHMPKMLFYTSKHISQITLGKEIIFTEFK